MFNHSGPAIPTPGLRQISRALVIAVALLAASASWVLAGQTSADWDPSVLKGKVTEFTLDNGLRFIVMERHDVPVFSFMTHVDAGSVDEPVGQTGLAHMFEHMAFKGTDEIGTKDYGKEKKLIEKIDNLFMELYAERAQGDRADPERISQIENEIEEAREEALKYVETNEFSQIIDRAGGVGLNASTGSDGT
ncbi:MAG: M16 family metallopeptidase, partial [Candidatus Krumholzibacteriia bacterium]